MPPRSVAWELRLITTAVPASLNCTRRSSGACRPWKVKGWSGNGRKSMPLSATYTGAVPSVPHVVTTTSWSSSMAAGTSSSVSASSPNRTRTVVGPPT